MLICQKKRPCTVIKKCLAAVTTHTHIHTMLVVIPVPCCHCMIMLISWGGFLWTLEE